MAAPDPADQGDEYDWRRCVAARRDGHRCNGRAVDEGLLCPFHDGRSDPQEAARASHLARDEKKRRQEELHALKRLGTRKVVAEALLEKALEIRQAIFVLADSAASGDVRSAQALIPWLDQALGKPTERVEHTAPVTPEDLQGLDTAELQRLVAEGRRRRLQLVGESESDSGSAQPPTSLSAETT